MSHVGDYRRIDWTPFSVWARVTIHLSALRLMFVCLCLTPGEREILVSGLERDAEERRRRALGEKIVFAIDEEFKRRGGDDG